MDRQISVPIKKEDAVSLRAGDYVTHYGNHLHGERRGA